MKKSSLFKLFQKFYLRIVFLLSIFLWGLVIFICVDLLTVFYLQTLSEKSYLFFANPIFNCGIVHNRCIQAQFPSAKFNFCVFIDQLDQVKFCYELLSELTIPQKQVCNAIAFNQNKELLLVCCDNNIKVYQFNDGYLKLIQILSKSRFTITVLTFFNYNRKCQFLSGSCDSFIEVRSINQLRSQKYIQKLDSHKRAISCLVIGQNQKMFLSGSMDQKIKLWSCYQQNQGSCQWSCQQTIKGHMNSVYALDINSKQNKAVSCGYDDKMLIMEIIQNMETYQLVLKQKISLLNFSFRILFINDSDFIFQSYCGKNLQLLQQDQNEKYVITQFLPVQCKSQPCNIFFKPQYINSKGFFACKNSQNLNFVYHNPVNNELVLLYSLSFDNYEQYGSLSEDGEYLITWDQKLEKIEVRKYKIIDDQNN